MKPSRKTATIPSLRWMTYAVAGLATAAGGTSSAEAEIHYSGRVEVQLHNGDNPFPLSGGASLQFRRSSTFGGYYDNMYVVNARQRGVATNPSEFFLHALKLRRRINVSTAGQFQAFGELVDLSQSGNFVERGQGLTAFLFDTGKGPQYGWARIRTTVGGGFNQIEIIDYAWADPGEPILTGQKKESVEPDAIVSQSGSLGLLALGRDGLVAWRAHREPGAGQEVARLR